MDETNWDYVCTGYINHLQENGFNLAKRNKLKFDNELQTIRFLYQSQNLRQRLLEYLNECTIHTSNDRHRSISLSDTYRSEGNEHYKQHRYDDAISSYTNAIISTPSAESTLLYQAYANRAMSLLAIKRYENAYDDCMIAKLDTDKKRLMKTLLRQTVCALECKSKSIVGGHIDDIERLMKGTSNEYLLNSVADLKCKYRQMKDEPEVKQLEIPKEKLVITKVSTDNGRYMVAGENIKAGEAIMIDEAFAFIPVNRQCEQCHNCGQFLSDINYPCHKCDHAVYCKYDCLSQHTFIHSYECPGYNINLWFNIGIAHLAMRTFLCGYSCTLKSIIEKEVSLDDPLPVWNKLLSTERFVYSDVFNLVTNFDKMDCDDYLRYSLTAVMLVEYLERFTGLFEESSLRNSKAYRVLVGAIILRHIGQLVCNGHGISSFDTNKIVNNWSMSIGKLNLLLKTGRQMTGIFPKISLLNHSCCPNIYNIFNGNTITIYATRNINEGEEILNCYGPNYKILRTPERRNELLKQYCFVCKCSACEADDYEPATFICSNKKCRHKIILNSGDTYWFTKSTSHPDILCKNCGTAFNFKWHKEFKKQTDRLSSLTKPDDIRRGCCKIFDLYDQSTELMTSENILRIVMLSSMLSKLQTIDFVKLQEWNLHDRFYEVCKEATEISINIFGYYSSEYIVVASQLLDLMAVRRLFNKDFHLSHSNSLATETLNDLSALIKPSMTYLPDEIRKIFQRYMDEFITSNRSDLQVFMGISF